MAGVPSYARSTAAWESRKTVRSQDEKQSKHTYGETRRQRMPVDHTGSRILHGYSLSTISSRSKARGTFRFFDLPPELRNRVYECLQLDERSCHISLYHPKFDNVLASLPPVLAANRQLCEEAGGYYFENGQFVFMTNGYRTDTFINLLKVIGTKNCQRVANNNNVIIRLIIPYPTLSREERRRYPHFTVDAVIRGNLLSDIAYVVGLRTQFASLLQAHSALKGWYIEAYETDRFRRLDQGCYTFFTSDATDLPPPYFHFERLLPFLCQIFHLFGNTQMKALGAYMQRHVFRDSPLKMMWDERWSNDVCDTGIREMRLPSGRKMRFNSRA